MFWCSSKARGLSRNQQGGRLHCLEAIAIKVLLSARVKIWWWKTWLFWPKRWAFSSSVYVHECVLAWGGIEGGKQAGEMCSISKNCLEWTPNPVQNTCPQFLRVCVMCLLNFGNWKHLMKIYSHPSVSTGDRLKDSLVDTQVHRCKSPILQQAVHAYPIQSPCCFSYILGAEAKAWCMLGKLSTTEQYLKFPSSLNHV